jgi:hypothetical protein
MSLGSADELVFRLCRIFPEFGTEWQQDLASSLDCAAETGDSSFSPTAHSVYFSFSPFVHRATSSEKQLKELAVLINEAVAEGGNAENAVATVFLEHLGRSPLRKVLWPMFSPAAKASCRP